MMMPTVIASIGSMALRTLLLPLFLLVTWVVPVRGVVEGTMPWEPIADLAQAGMLGALDIGVTSDAPPTEGTTTFMTSESVLIGSAYLFNTFDTAPTARLSFNNAGRTLFYIDADDTLHISPGVTAEDIARGAVRVVGYESAEANRWREEAYRCERHEAVMQYGPKD